MSQAQYDVIVIGEGVSGLTAARELAKAGLNVATLEAQLFGGLVVNVNELDPVPEGAPSSGAELAAELMQANSELGVASIQEAVTELSASSGLLRISTNSGSYTAKRVVVASGARLRKLGVPGESEFEGRGVSQCADCDGPMYQNEEAVVVGGGDSAFQEALVLAQYCGRVHLVHRRDAFRAEPHWVEQVKASDKIAIITNAAIEAIVGGKMVEKACIRYADGSVCELPCAGVFVYIGLEPSTAFLPAEVKLDPSGFIATNDSFETSIPGVSAIGAVRSGFGGTLRHATDEARHTAQVITQQLR